MEIMVDLRWAGGSEEQDHRVAIEAAPGAPGAGVVVAICEFLGIHAAAEIDGTNAAAACFGEPPLVDGAAITLSELAPGAAGPVGTGTGVRANVLGGDAHRGQIHARGDDTPRLTVVAGAASGTVLAVARGSQWLSSTDGVPTLASRKTGRAATEIVMDHTGIRIMPGSVPLREGDRLRCGESWLEVSTPAAGSPEQRRVQWGWATAGEHSPSEVIAVRRGTGHGARLGLIMGLLPLVLGVVITIVTGMWFFMLFSALGAIVAVVSWAVGRAAAVRERARVAAALERDLTRCHQAAPSAAEVVNRLRLLDSGASLNHPALGAAAIPHERWVRLGEGPRTAAVTLGDGPSAAPAEHHLAPVLIDMSRVHHLEVRLPSRNRENVVNAVAVQLLTGPGAFQNLIVDPAVGWRAPLLPTLHVVDPQRHRSVVGPALEIYSTRTAALIPVTGERVRLIVSVPGERADATAGGALLTWESTAVIACDVPDAVPGLDASAGRDRMNLCADGVTASLFAHAMQQWSRVQATVPSLRDVSGLPHTVGSHVILPEPDQIPDVWAATARLPSLSAAVGLSRRGVEELSLGDEHPHVLIAGTTGCGKSEVLRTFVASLACRFAPERVEFLFVDFKGGAALAPLSGLPHRCTLLTDLAPEDVRRALEFLRAELRRRERVLSEHGLSDFRRVLHRSRAHEPLVFRELVIVVDEVKMLVDAFPAAGDELAKIATVGRSLGIHLVLATQRPQGAIPSDVRANVTQAVCLRVRTDQDSVDVVGSPLAAAIAAETPGRAFIDSGHGAPVEVQTAILTSCAAPPVTGVRVRLVGRNEPGHPSRAVETPDAAVNGVQRVVADIARAHRVRQPTAECLPDPDGTRSPEDVSVSPVPAPLPECSVAVPTAPGHVDLGPAENSTEHWTGRASWHLLADGALFLIGRPEHTSAALLSVLEQVVRPRSAGPGRDTPAVYVISTTATIRAAALTRSRQGLLHGTADAADIASLKGLLDRLSAGSQRYLSGSDGTADPAPPAVLLVEDWDRCCTLLRSSPWAPVEDDLLAIAASGSRAGIAAVFAGDRSLSVGRASSAARTRVYFPADQTAEALLHWPTLPAVKAIPLRGVLQGAAADRCAPAVASRGQGVHTVVQLPAGPRDASEESGRGEEGAPRTARPEPDTGIWPRYRPLPDRWSGPARPVRGLLIGVGTDHVPAVHDWPPGSTLLVVGPARSGRSSYLESVAGQLHETPPARCHPAAPGDVDDLFAEAEPGTTVLIDDADVLPAAVVQRLGALWQPGTGTSGVGGRTGLRLIVTVRLSDGLPSLFPPLMSWRHTADTLLLRPRKAYDGDLFGASLSGMPMGGSPGRGYWIHRGTAEHVQTAHADG
ncbi:hypothetical protein IEE91_05350 [Kocuria sp. cx-455]|uniref:FtsK/SpoIIIE domain-containing protein n=1 Tax=Kocuria sp. cx-455 TaxID=2771377 RepID=UPI001682F812|nr:FtsK/SpoIIIE domain-containing protein [Kocuria sp. cx-455]MBD2764629.1 hypothetical protein [Kocuria sp. cx-455]